MTTAQPDPQQLRDRIADAIRAATCPGECGNSTEEECRRTRFQPIVWHQGRVIEVDISGPVDRIAALLADALTEVTGEATAEHHFVDGAKYLCHVGDHYCPPGTAA